MMGIENLDNNIYHPHIKVETKRYRWIISSMLRWYLADHWLDWYKYIRVLTDAYNVSIHRNTRTISFGLVLSRPEPAFSTSGQVQHA